MGGKLCHGDEFMKNVMHLFGYCNAIVSTKINQGQATSIFFTISLLLYGMCEHAVTRAFGCTII